MQEDRSNECTIISITLFHIICERDLFDELLTTMTTDNSSLAVRQQGTREKLGQTDLWRVSLP